LDALEFHDEREVQPLPEIGLRQNGPDRPLLANEGKPSRKRLALIRVLSALRSRRYEGG
jgi:hypothetical protein